MGERRGRDGGEVVLQAVLLVSGLLYLAVSFVPGAFFAQHPYLHSIEPSLGSVPWVVRY